MAQMGFEEMSRGRYFKLPTGESTPPKQVDVYVRDQLSALVISCKESKTWRKRSLQAELESLHGHSDHWRNLIRNRYSADPPHFVGFVIATKNIEWTKEDEERAHGWGIRIIRDEEIDYYTKLIQLKYGTPLVTNIQKSTHNGSITCRMK